jgi:stress response protein SCP2
MEIKRGQRLPLIGFLQNNTQSFQIELSIVGVSVDFTCFGLNADGKLLRDEYMTFFNQPQTPCNGVMVSFTTNTATFLCDLTKLPSTIETLSFTAAIDGSQAMNQMQSGYLKFLTNGQEVARFNFSGSDFNNEKALMLGDIYRKNGEWRFNAVGQGFNGGLDSLLKHFGGEVLEEPAQLHQSKISLEKKISEAAPKLLTLAKKATVSLEKNNLTDVMARVGLVLDASGSMRSQYATGKVQELINRLLPLAVHFDDDGELDTWTFSTTCLNLPAVTIKDYEDYIDTAQQGWKKWGMMGTNNEPIAIKKVIDHYSKTQLPVLVIFVSDGGVGSDKEIKKLLTDASTLPIFWQFLGIGGRNYGILEKLDTLGGRFIDNCGFFSLDDLNSISEQELYERLLKEFPLWLKEAKQKRIIA